MVLPLNPVVHKGDRLTDDEFYTFCQANSKLRLERDETGQILIEMSTNTKAGFKNSALNGELYARNKQLRLGYLTDSSARFTLPDSSVRAPDVAWICRERCDTLPADEQDKFAKICPDFVIELMSDKDEKYTLPAKMEKYLQNGVRLAWMIDPSQRQTTIFRPDTDSEIKPFTGSFSGETVLPGFELRLSDLL